MTKMEEDVEREVIVEDGERWLRWMKIEEDGGRCRKRGGSGRWRKM